MDPQPTWDDLAALLPPGVMIRAWQEGDFPAIQRLSSVEGWPTPQGRPAEALASWQRAWPALVAVYQRELLLEAGLEGCVAPPAEAPLPPWKRPELDSLAHCGAAGGAVIGFVRALSDGAVTTYIAELLVARAWRRRGVGAALVEACHRLAPRARLDVLAGVGAGGFYRAEGFCSFQGYRKGYV